MDITQAFLTSTYTKTQALRRFRLVKEFIQLRLFESKQSFEEDLKTFLAKHQQKTFRQALEADSSFVNQLGEQFFNQFLPTSADKQLKELEGAINTTKTVILYLPIELPEDEAKRLGMWLKGVLGQTAIFDIVFDPELIAGCSISYNGNYKDYSLRNKIEENKTEVINLLTSFKQ